KITAATDIKTRSREYEIEREHGVRIGDARYDLVTVRGELYLKNCKSKDIEIEIKKTTTGEVIEAGYEGKVEQIVKGIRGVNPKSLISWEFPLPAGKEKTIYYKYRVYVQGGGVSDATQVCNVQNMEIIYFTLPVKGDGSLFSIS
ncbi:hypothetical protein KAT73_04070, partial [candidate division WOR-3 bacterium]|nr:hypothetical protein [candidate division WOR-3 bacterium]